MDNSPFDASRLVAKADQVFRQSQAERREQFREELNAVTESAQSAPGGGAFTPKDPPPTSNSTLPWPPMGFVSALAQFIYQQAPRPVAEVAIVGALGLLAGVAGRQWTIPGSGLNLYVVLVARSAIGKEAMHSGIAKLVAASAVQCPEAGFHVSFTDFVSGPALIKSCANNPCFVNVAGEIGHKFLAMAADRDSSMRSLRKILTTLYSKSGPDNVSGGITYSNQDNNVETTTGVTFSLIGETTPGTFYESITDAMMRDGFMSRFCVIEYSGDRPAKNPTPVQQPPPEVTAHLVTIVQQASLAASANAYCEVTFSDDARTYLDRFDDECDAAIHAAGDDEGLRQLWNRAHLKALRVAALLAVGDSPFSPVVSRDQAEWSVALVRHGIAAFERRIRLGEVGEGSDGGREQKVLDLCREFLTLPTGKLPSWLKNGEQMQSASIVPRRYLQQRTQRLTAFENFKLGHTAALNMAIKTATTNGNLMEVKGDKLVDMFNYHGQAFRVLDCRPE